MRASRAITLAGAILLAILILAAALVVLWSVPVGASAQGQRDYVKCAKRATKRLNEHRACFGMKAVHPQITTDTAHAVWKDACRRCKKLRHRMTHPGGSGVERWRPLVRHCFGRQGIGWREDEAIGVIARESGGDPNNGNGTCYGLFQFNASLWGVSVATACDPWWNVNRAARAVKAQGGWCPAWAATAP